MKAIIDQVPMEIHLNGLGSLARDVEKLSVREFFYRHRELLKGRVLDFGSGDGEYGDLVETGEYALNVKGQHGGYFDAIICDRVLQYVDDPSNTLRWALRASLLADGHALITYPASGEQNGERDKWRFTEAGMEKLLADADLKVVAHEACSVLKVGDFELPLICGVICRK